MPDLSSLGDPQLVVLFQQGNSAAYDTLYQRHFDALCAYAAHSGGLGPDDATDLAQETLTRALTAWRNGRSVPEPKAWLLRTLRNLLIDTYRHNKVRALPESRCYAPDREDEFSLDDFSSEWLEADPQAQMRNEDMRAVVELALGGLTPPNREALLSQYRDELSPEEMAAAWHVSLQEVYRRTHAARCQFGKCLPAAVLARVAPRRCPEFAAAFPGGLPLDPGRRVRMVHHAQKCTVCHVLVLKYVRPEEILVLLPTFGWQEGLCVHGTAPDASTSEASARAASGVRSARFKDLTRLWQRSSARLTPIVVLLLALGITLSPAVPQPSEAPVAATVTASPTDVTAVPTPGAPPLPTLYPLTLAAPAPVTLPTREHGRPDDPQLALDGSGAVHLVWQDTHRRSTGLDILHKQRLSGSWSETVSLTDGFDVVTPGSFSLFLNPAGQLCAGWEGATTLANTRLGLYMRCWEGSHWTPPQLVANTSATMRDIRPVDLLNGALHLVYTANRGDIFFGDIRLAAADASGLAIAPAVAVDSAGGCHVVWARMGDGTRDGSAVPPWELEYRYSADDGRSWTDVQALKDRDALVIGPVRLEGDRNGHVHLVWDAGGALKYRRWTAGGDWEAPVTLSRPGAGNNGTTVGLAADWQGLAHVVWNNAGMVRYTRQRLDLSWTAPEVVGDGCAGGPGPQIVVDASGVRHIAWASAEPDQGIIYRQLRP